LLLNGAGAAPPDIGIPDSSAVAHFVQNEMARTIEDVLSRRTRALILDARATLDAAPAVATAMARELGWSDKSTAEQLARFRATAESYTGVYS
jgi:glycerol-3-phosphate dehydrogenase